MTETIDPREWLHQHVHIAYPDMMKRLGAVVNEHGRITCASRFMFDELYRFPANRPVFDAAHLSAAEFITTLRNVAFERNGYSRLKEMIADLMHNSANGMISGYCPMTIYIWVMQEMTPVQKHMINRICFQELRTNDMGWVIKCSETIRQSFEKLGQAIEDSLDKMSKQIENGEMKRGQVSPKLAEPV